MDTSAQNSGENNLLPPHERPFDADLAQLSGYEHVAYKTLDEARSDQDAIVIFEGDSGGQIYLTCPVSKIGCSHQSLQTLLGEIGKFAWGDDEGLYYQRARPDGMVWGGMGGGRVKSGVWIHPDFRNLLEVGIDILPEVTDVIEGRAASVLPGIVARLVIYLESLDVSKAKRGQINFGNVANIAEILVHIGPSALAALPVLRKLESTGIFGGGKWSSFELRDRIRQIEEQSKKESAR
jgi:hypothetical protein